MRMTIEPDQITDDYGKAHLNMMDSGAGGVGVECYLFSRPTYLLLKDNYIYFITFQSQAWADEWFEAHPTTKIVWSFEPEEES